jgi:hypothetical protein
LPRFHGLHQAALLSAVRVTVHLLGSREALLCTHHERNRKHHASRKMLLNQSVAWFAHRS